ncbi:C6 zinc finger domain-containing protein [Sarocladium implicatum]|nr:C6 zinc finger domain-containing protein [Sarocladium implicatum]
MQPSVPDINLRVSHARKRKPVGVRPTAAASQIKNRLCRVSSATHNNDRGLQCDEKRPVCSACLRRDRPCVWPPLTDRANGNGLNSGASQAGSPSQGTPEPSQIFRIPSSASRQPGPLAIPPQAVPSQDVGGLQFDLNDLALLHHWSFHSSSTICLAKGEIGIWSRVFPEIGFQYSFVTRAILAVAALHLATKTLDSTQRAQYINRALSHHDIGLSGFRHAVTAITIENSESLFVWSVLNLIYVFGMFNHGPLAPPTSDKDQILGVEWISMMRGIGAVLHPVHAHLAGGRLGTLISLGNWDQLELDESDEWDIQMRRTRETWQNSADKDTYEQSLSILRRCRRFMDQFEHMSDAERSQQGYNQSWSAPFIFISMAPKAFFELLRQRQPPALVLFAHFGSLLYGLRAYWFIGDLGKKIIQVVDELLGPYWRQYISEPLEYASAGTTAIS